METEIENSTNGNGDYEAFLKEMGENGVVVDGMEFAKDGQPLIQPPEVKHTNAAIIASVPNAQSIYEKKDKAKGILLDFMARTNFRSDTEFKLFLDWIEWCEDFGVGYDGPMRWLVGLNSVEGMARNQYVEAITVTRFSSYKGNYGKSNNQLRSKYKEGELP